MTPISAAHLLSESITCRIAIKLQSTIHFSKIIIKKHYTAIQGSLFFVIKGETSLEKTHILADFIKN